MNVIVFKLDNPDSKHEWWVRDFRIKCFDDIEKIMGICAKHLYSEIYHIDEDDDPDLIKAVKGCLLASQPQSAKDTIMRLFTAINRYCNG